MASLSMKKPAADVVDLTLSDDEDDRKPSAIDIIDLTIEDDDNDERHHKMHATSKISCKRKDKRQRREEEALKAMRDTHMGRAFLFVEALIPLLGAYSSKGIEPIGKDDAVFLLKRLLECQSEFKGQNKPTQVSLAYHYTPEKNLQAIRSDGLLTVQDRVAANNANTRNHAFFGKGIYSGTNPLAFTKYGSEGLLLAILKGTEQNVGSKSKPRVEPLVDTIVGNKTGDAPYEDEVILRKSCQVVPLIQFSRQQILTGDKAFADALWAAHKQVQLLVDEYFNDSVPTPLTRVVSKAQNRVDKHKPDPSGKYAAYRREKVASQHESRASGALGLSVQQSRQKPPPKSISAAIHHLRQKEAASRSEFELESKRAALRRRLLSSKKSSNASSSGADYNKRRKSSSTATTNEILGNILT